MKDHHVKVTFPHIHMDGRKETTAPGLVVATEDDEEKVQYTLYQPVLSKNQVGQQLVNFHASTVVFPPRKEQSSKLLSSLDEAYGREPMVTLAAGPAPREPFRVEISGCVGVRLEGLRLLGEAGQSGVSIADSAHVSLVRCWVEAFEQGPSGRPGVFAPGRGVQVGNAGTEHDPIELLWCDIGWNDVRRPSMPVRGAALSVFASHVRLSRCYVHDNHASDKPGDITVDADSRLWGDATNHRANNTVTRR